MTLHQIVDLNSALKEFNALINTGSHLCIADLVKEDGSFHTNIDGFEGHNGFDKNELSRLFEEHNFKPIYYNIYYNIDKEVFGTQKKYPQFLMIGRKK